MTCHNNPAVYSSFLFALSALLAWSLGFADVAIACLACMATSAANHACRCRHALLQRLDQIVVRAIAAFYVLHALLSFGLSPATVGLYATAALTAAAYIHIGFAVGHRACAGVTPNA